MGWICELNKLCCEDKDAHVRLKDGEEFDCSPDSLTYDGDGNEEMTVKMKSGMFPGWLRGLSEEEIESVKEI